MCLYAISSLCATPFLKVVNSVYGKTCMQTILGSSYRIPCNNDSFLLFVKHTVVFNGIEVRKSRSRPSDEQEMPS